MESKNDIYNLNLLRPSRTVVGTHSEIPKNYNFGSVFEPLRFIIAVRFRFNLILTTTDHLAYSMIAITNQTLLQNYTLVPGVVL